MVFCVLYVNVTRVYAMAVLTLVDLPIAPTDQFEFETVCRQIPIFFNEDL